MGSPQLPGMPFEYNQGQQSMRDNRLIYEDLQVDEASCEKSKDFEEELDQRMERIEFKIDTKINKKLDCLRTQNADLIH